MSKILCDILLFCALILAQMKRRFQVMTGSQVESGREFFMSQNEELHVFALARICIQKILRVHIRTVDDTFSTFRFTCVLRFFGLKPCLALMACREKTSQEDTSTRYFKDSKRSRMLWDDQKRAYYVKDSTLHAVRICHTIHSPDAMRRWLCL